MNADQHRAAQLAVRAATLRDLLRLWRAFNPDDIAGSWNVLGPALAALVAARAPLSAGLAANYYTSARLAAAASPFTPFQAAAPDVDYVASSLAVTGPSIAGRLYALGRPAQAITEAALTATAGNVSRLVLNTGRQTIVDNARTDPAARGWQRIASANACEFCTQLSGRVYRSDNADFPAHNHCGCTADPVFA